MKLKIIEDISDIDMDHSILYFSQSYLSSQHHHQFIKYHIDNIELIVSISEKIAISIPKSPFGSFFMSADTNLIDFSNFINTVKKDLKKRNISQLVVHHPAKIYDGFVPKLFLENTDFKLTYSDINQHIPLVNDWKDGLHKMQQRKLQSLYENGFEFRKMDHSELKTAHGFISACRQVQGLTINIEWEHLNKLNTRTNAYQSFGVFRDNKLSAVCITVNVSKEIAYYYLPATSPTFRTESPMVMLIEGMVEYYKNLNYTSFDLGVSSVLGKYQDSLILFKERMGAKQTEKSTYSLEI